MTDTAEGRAASEAALSVLQQVLQATVNALTRVPAEVELTEALFVAASTMLDAVVAGRGVVTMSQFLAMIEAIAHSDELRGQASELRKQRLAEGLALRERSHPEDPAVRRAATLWSAIMANYYAGIRHAPEIYLPRDDAHLHERAQLLLADTFRDVMGADAPQMTRRRKPATRNLHYR